MKKLLKEYIPQVLLIVFSVVLGLYLNQRLVDRNERAEANELLYLIIEEVKNNRAIMDEWHHYHFSAREIFKNLKSKDAFKEKFIDDKKILYDTLFTRGTLMQQMPSNSAWEIAKSNPLVSNIDYNYMQMLTDLYNIQEYMLEPALIKMSNFYHTTGVNRPEIAKENLDILYFYFHETVGRETYYMQLSDKVLTQIKVAK